MIENWEFYVLVGLGITTIAGLSIFIQSDDSIKKEIERNKAIFKTNFLGELMEKIEIRVGNNDLGITDNQLDTDLNFLFIGASIFEECKTLNKKIKNCPNYIRIIIATFGIYFAIYPLIDALSQDIKTLYISGLISIIIFLITIVLHTIYTHIELKKIIRELKNRNIFRGSDEVTEVTENDGE